MGKSLRGLFSFFILIVWFRAIEARPQQSKPGCWYEGKRYQEDQMVNTTEPCLRCRCNDGSLRCRLRICPRLPVPVPHGCTTKTPRDNACCAELVCDDSHERNVTARRDPSKDIRRHEDGCLHEGVRYGPGSAMMGSRRCEYCYCISGSRRCLRPRCLLPLAGCIPLYAPYSCCPVAYNCDNSAHHTFSSLGSSSSVSRNGCRVGNRSYDEGEMIRETGRKATCDNCFCAMGGVRCIPLACAPPLQGCAPIVREGHCCPSTYNCSGTIEVKATQNYASYAFISKDYAKFRKETNFFTMDPVNEEGYESFGNSTFEGRSHMNSEQSTSTTTTSDENLTNSEIEEIQRNSPNSFELESTTLLESSTLLDMNNFTTISDNTSAIITTISSEETETMNNEIPTETIDNSKSLTEEETTLSTVWTTNEKMEIPTTLESITSDDISKMTTILSNEEFFDFTNLPISHEVLTESATVVPLEFSTTIRSNDETTMDYSTVEGSTIFYHEKKISLPEVRNNVKNVENKNSMESTTRRIFESTTKFLKIYNSSVYNTVVDKGASKDFGIIDSSIISIKGPATGSPTTVLMPDNMFVINVTLRTNVSVGNPHGVTVNPVRSISPDIEAILNITNRKKGEDYDYDYSQPTLPPSLPNVRIIPFVVADALVKQDEEVLSQVTNYPLGSVGLSPQELRPTVASGTAENFYDIVTQKNRFSPPIETEGGFVPREPPYYDPPYRSTDHNLEIHNGVTMVPADITNSHMKNDGNDEIRTKLAGICVFENRNYRHGDLLPSSGHCIICICYYGEVACSDEKCPPLKIGCRRHENDKICCGKIICVDAEESPTLVLDRADAIAPSPREPLPSLDGMVSPDPFRDVIKTKPAPDLPSLIEDMIPYYVEHRVTKLSGPTTPMTSANHGSSPWDDFDTRPDHKFSPESTGIQDIPFLNGDSVKSLEINVTSSNQKNHQPYDSRISALDLSEVTGSHGQRKNETSSFVETLGAPSASGEKEPAERNPESSIFSFGSVFDLLFSENTDSPMTSEALETTTFKPKISSQSFSDFSANFFTNIQAESSSNIPPKINFNGTAALLTKTTQGHLADNAKVTGDKYVNDSTKASTIVTRMSTTTNDPTSSWLKVKEPQRTTMDTSSIGWSETTTTTTTPGSADNEISTSNSGILKLAGCNIYGRMYGVGRIITELSSPCLECRCTEVGVQCKQLVC